MSTIKFSRTTGGVKITIDGGTPFFIEGEQEITTSASTDGNYVVVRWDGFDHPFSISNSFDIAGTAVTGDQTLIKNTIDSFLNTGSGGTGVANATVADKTAANALTRVANRLVLVTADETNNSDTTLYYDNGTTLKYLLTVPQ